MVATHNAQRTLHTAQRTPHHSTPVGEVRDSLLDLGGLVFANAPLRRQQEIVEESLEGGIMGSWQEGSDCDLAIEWLSDWLSE